MKKVKPRAKRQKRIKQRIAGTFQRPRLCVFRSNMHIYSQVVDDEKGQTLASISDLNLKAKERSGKKVDIAGKVGERLGKKLRKAKILEVVFDRSGYKYHGRVKALADAVRKSGIKF